jgi:DsbC/DsbD-like thiol-disulfide interchange protein
MTFVRDLLPKSLALACALTWAAPAIGADASDWAMDIRSAVRLIGASAPQNVTQYSAAVEIRMDPGWHTYWRYPGDSGVPPKFDFSNSENVGEVRVLYPAPHGFTDEAGIFIGYRDHVIFPVRVTPRDPKKPVQLQLDLFYAVCDKLCVPAAGKADLTLAPGQPSSFDEQIARAVAEVPKQVSAKNAGLTVKRVIGGPKPVVAVDVADTDVREIFVEGPNGDWALPIPKPAPGAPAGHQQFSFALDGLPPGVDPKAPLDLTLTIIRRDRAIEATTRLD